MGSGEDPTPIFFLMKLSKIHSNVFVDLYKIIEHARKKINIPEIPSITGSDKYMY
jgi:hypothetical protein